MNRKIPGGLELRILDTSQFKGLIHWRLSRKDGETQRFTLHADTGIDYAKQILAEELRRGRRGKQEWTQKNKDNHLLDCEVYAAACADSEWTPALSYLAKNVQVADEEVKHQKPKEDHEPVQRNRPGWFRNR